MTLDFDFYKGYSIHKGEKLVDSPLSAQGLDNIF